MFHSLYAVFLVFFFFVSVDATAQQRLDGFFPNSSPLDVFAVLFVNDGTPLKIAPPPKKIGGKNVHFLAKIQTHPSSDRRCAETRKDFAKTKTTGINNYNI